MNVSIVPAQETRVQIESLRGPKGEKGDPGVAKGTAENSLMLGGKAPEYYDAPLNLLDNSSFICPVNQRGQTQYAGASGYTIDRWRAPSKLQVDVGDGYVTFTCISDSVANGVTQYIAPEKALLAGETVTFAMEDAEGNIRCGSAVVPESGYRNAISNLEEGWYARIYCDDGVMRASFMVAVGSHVSVKWAALYKGAYTADTLPPYTARTYAQELMECQRYYHLYAAQEERPENGLDCAPPMRIEAVTQGEITIGDAVYYYNSADI